MVDVLPEVPVSEADPETRAIYDAIMKHTGVGSPALIYRHFAVYPGFLKWIWDLVGPELEGGTLVPHALATARDLMHINLGLVYFSDIEELGVDAASHAVIDDILATYNKMNPINFGLICAVRSLLAEETPSAEAPRELANVEDFWTEKPGPLPAPLALDEMRADIRDIVLRLSSTIPSPDALVIPTLYRHLAIWPDFLAHLAPGLQAALERGDIEDQMAALTWKMQPLINHLRARAMARNPDPPPIDDPAAMIETIDSFLFTIPQLVVIGYALRGAIPRAGENA